MKGWYNAYPDVKMTDKEISAKSLKTTEGFMHHKLKVCVQVPEESPESRATMNTPLFLRKGKTFTHSAQKVYQNSIVPRLIERCKPNW